MITKQFKRQPTLNELAEFSDDAFVAKCKDKLGSQVWVVIDFTDKNEA